MKTLKKILSATILGGASAAMFSTGVGFAVVILSLLFGGGASAGNMFNGIFDPSALTLPDIGVQSVSDLIYQEKFVSPKWRSFMDFQPGIVHDTQIPIMGNFEGLAGYVRDNCDTTANPGQIGSSQKKWQPKKYRDIFEECADNLETTFWKFFLKPGVDKNDLQDTDYARFVEDRLSKYMSDPMIYRLIFFTDTTIASGGTNNLGAGDLKFFNSNEGIFKQLDAIVAATAARGVTITENAQASYAAQAFATATPSVHPVTDYLTQLYYNATMELRGAQNPVILVTQSVADQYAQERKAATASVELAYLRTETGIKYFEFNGVPVIPIPTWDLLIKRHFDNGTKWLKPHRMIYTTTNNMVVGTEEEANLGTLKSFYSEDREKWVVKFGFKFDVKVLLDELTQYAS